ncbi:MAG: C4-type zinc ribbon domain-containing protein [Acidimicrobiales bacterium]|jgi:hypothetical protein|nr:C4-type zinc ribbon domain-containing protein [Acidimicrobiales bacterium]
MSELERLLDLQDHDTTLDQLHHRRATLPVRERVRANEAALTDLARQRAAVQARRDELDRRQRRAEDEAASIEAKAGDVDRKLYGGTVTSPRELQALQDDLAALRRHQRELEDQALEAMEEAEPVDAELAAMDGRRVVLDAEGVAALAELAEAEASIDTELAAVGAERDALAQDVEPALLRRYEDLRRHLGGVAVARLVGSSCGGCHLSLSAAALDQMRHDAGGGVAHCEECGRILVH